MTEKTEIIIKAIKALRLAYFFTDWPQGQD